MADLPGEPVLPVDPLWPRAGDWISSSSPVPGGRADAAILGVPAFRTSLSPTRADTTPGAVRQALRRFGTGWSGGDLRDLAVVDLGDVEEPDGPDGEQRVRDAVASAEADLLIALGGDNSITCSVAMGRWGSAIAGAGLITLDAHHDLRDGISNGSPVRRLVEAGLAGVRIVQIGISDFANSADYRARARDLGITVIPREDLLGRTPAEVASEALSIAAAGGGPVHVDLDVDVCDRSVAPGCPASVPGGLSAMELRQFARLLAADSRVTSLDVTEVDAAADSPDGRTVRLAALMVLEALAGVSQRTSAGS